MFLHSQRNHSFKSLIEIECLTLISLRDARFTRLKDARFTRLRVDSDSNCKKKHVSMKMIELN